jgi:hypothetical protein
LHVFGTRFALTPNFPSLRITFNGQVAAVRLRKPGRFSSKINRDPRLHARFRMKVVAEVTLIGQAMQRPGNCRVTSVGALTEYCRHACDVTGEESVDPEGNGLERHYLALD